MLFPLPSILVVLTCLVSIVAMAAFFCTLNAKIPQVSTLANFGAITP